MTNRRHIQCTSCGTKTIVRTAIGHGSYQEFAFPCFGCGVEIRYGLKIDQTKPDFEYTKLINATWIDVDTERWHEQDGEIQNVVTFDGEALIPIGLGRDVTPFIATSFLAKNPQQFWRHQSVRACCARSIHGEIEKLMIHFENRNSALFDKQAKGLDYGPVDFKSDADRLRFLFRAIEQYGLFFRPGTDAQVQMIRQRINLAETIGPGAMAQLADYYVKSGKDVTLLREIDGIRKRWCEIYSALQALYTTHYWDTKRHSLDDYSLAEKRFEELKPLYVDCFETLCRVSVLAAAIECIIQTGALGVQGAKKILTIEEFDRLKNGLKPDLLRNLPVAGSFVPFIDNRLRNGIGHHSAHYDVRTDSVDYAIENQSGIQRFTISYVRFCEKVMLIYGQIEAVAIYLHWLRGKVFGLTGRLV